MSSNGITREKIVLLSFTFHIPLSLFHFIFIGEHMASSFNSDHCLHKHLKKDKSMMCGF